MNYIYMIANSRTGKFYIGSTTQHEKRFARHEESLRNGRHHNSFLQEDYNTYGATAFRYVLLEQLSCKRSLRDREQEYLDLYYTSGVLYNISKHSTCGDLISYHPNKEDIARRTSETLLKNNSILSKEERKAKWGQEGAANGMYGNTHSEEARAAISEKAKAYYKEHGNYRKGKSLEEVFGKEEAARLRKALSDSAKERVGAKNPFYGKTHSEETRVKISEAHKGKSNPNCWRAVSCEGVIYESVSKAAKHYGVCGGTIIHRSKSKNYPDYFYV